MMLPDSFLKPEQSMFAVDWTLKPPLTLLRAGRSGVVKFPEKSIAPPILANTGKLIAWRSVLLAIWAAPPTLLSRGMERLARLPLASIAKPPRPVAKLPTEVKLGAIMLFMKLP